MTKPVSVSQTFLVLPAETSKRFFILTGLIFQEVTLQSKGKQLNTLMELHLPNNFTRWREKERRSYRENKENVLFEHVYPLLEWNTILRLRLVCKGNKHFVDKYLREGDGYKRCPQITIYERSECEERSMGAFLKMNLPTTAIYLVNVSGIAYFERESNSIEAFVQNGLLHKKITHLRVHRLNHYPRGIEERFYACLDKLESLETDEFGMRFGSQEEAEIAADLLTEITQNSKKVKDMYKRLKKLMLGTKKPRENVKKMNHFPASHSLMFKCPNLEYAGDAFSSFMHLEEDDVDPTNALGIAFTLIGRQVEEHSRNLKFYDFASFHNDVLAENKCIWFRNSPKFAKLLTLCGKRGIKLYNVNAGWFSGPLEGVNWMETTAPVVSMVNLHGNAVSKKVNTDNNETVPVPMPNLEKLVITTSESCLLPYTFLVKRMMWPKLRVLEVKVDSEMMGTQAISMIWRFPAESTATLFKWLFMDISRPTLTELSLTFVKEVHLEPLTKNVVGRLGTCCPNLKKLALFNWPGHGDLLKRALRELGCLQEMNLDRCELVRDDTFEITSLKNLKKLSLLHLNEMPGITDALFKNVLPHLHRLTDLTFSSERAVLPKAVFRLRK